jgi:predicted small lipoprotein YifL
MRVAVVVAVAAVALGACGSKGPSDAKAADAPGDATSTAVPFPAPANGALAVGETAAMRVFLHCGLRYAMIDGTTWETTAKGDGSPPGGLPDLVVGTATRTSQNTVRFTVSAPSSVSWVFHPSAEPDDFVCF